MVRQSNMETVTWAKMYPTDQCFGIAIVPNERYAYFANKEEPYLGLNMIDCSTGSSTGYLTLSYLNVTSGIKNFDMGPTQNYIAISGNLINSAGHS